MGLLNFCVSAVGIDREGRKGRRWICIVGNTWMALLLVELTRRPSDANDDEVFRFRSIVDSLIGELAVSVDSALH
jgi:hypothetical protein